MVWFYIGLFFADVLLGLMQASFWVFFGVNVIFVGILFYKRSYPILYEKNPEKVMEYLKNSKHPHFQFYYHFFNDELEEKVQDGKSEEVLKELNELIPKMKGLKLLSIIQYKQEVLRKV